MKDLIKTVLLFIILFAAVNVLITSSFRQKDDNSHNIEINRAKHLIIEYEKENGVAAENLSALVSFSMKSGGGESFEYIYSIVSAEAGGADKLINDNELLSEDEKSLYYKTESYIYRIDYRLTKGTRIEKLELKVRLIVNTVLGIALLIAVFTIIYYRRKLVRPFMRLAGLPEEIAKGRLVKDIPESQDKYFGKFTWGMNMLREQLEDTKAKNLQLERDKKVLLMSLSHDIKTPLNAISLYSKAISKGLYSGDKVISSAESIQDKVMEIEDYMKRIVNASNEDIIEFNVNMQDVYLNDLMERVSDYYNDKMKLKSVDFSIGSFSNKLIRTDPDRLVEVIQNIIENALKYGDGKKIWIDINEESSYLRIDIKNTGCTLAKHELANIFESFYRGTNTKKKEGSGLGLYICRRLMTLMDGEIHADIISGEGKDASDIMCITLELHS